jgi:hypothetical protein
VKKVLLLVMCIFGFQGASYGFLGTALNTESEKAFLKSLETHSGMTDEQAKELLLKAARLQERLHKWSAAGAGISAVPLAIVIACIEGTIRHLTTNTHDAAFHSGDVALIVGGPLMVLTLAFSGFAFGQSLAASIKAKKRANRYKKMAQHAAHLKYYQRFTERCGYMARGDGKSAWDTVAQGRQNVMKKGFNAQLIGTTLGALATVVSCVVWKNSLSKPRVNSVNRFLAIIASVAFTLFSAYGLKGIVRKQAMKKFMDQIKNESLGALLIAHDPETELLGKIANWEQEEAAAKVQPVE